MSKYKQHDCNKDVSGLYYINSPDLNTDDICEKICSAIDYHDPKMVYIGITHHPCGRFTNSYDSTTPLPTKMNFEFEYESDMTSIDEAAHCILYETMYVICSLSVLELMRELEIDIIEKINKLRPGKLSNGNKGGGGHLPKSDLYFLYICIKKPIL